MSFQVQVLRYTYNNIADGIVHKINHLHLVKLNISVIYFVKVQNMSNFKVFFSGEQV